MDSAAACYFPTLSTVIDEGEMHTGLAPVNLNVIPLDEFCRAQEIPATRVVAAAWLLALRLYTGNDAPSMGFVPTEGAQLQCCSVDFEDGAMCSRQIIDSLQFRLVEDGPKNFNTAVAPAAVPDVGLSLCLASARFDFILV